jgi:PAS domain S-box-containing protein
MNKKTIYVPPRLTAYHPKNVPESLKLLLGDLISGGAHVAPVYTTVVDPSRKFIEVSDGFSKLLGYETEELIGTPYDHLTVPNTADISTTYNLFKQLGYMHGLWMLAHRTGYRIVIRYEAWLRPDSNIQSNIEVVQTII